VKEIVIEILMENFVTSWKESSEEKFYFRDWDGILWPIPSQYVTESVTIYNGCRFVTVRFCGGILWLKSVTKSVTILWPHGMKFYWKLHALVIESIVQDIMILKCIEMDAYNHATITKFIQTTKKRLRKLHRH